MGKLIDAAALVKAWANGQAATASQRRPHRRMIGSGLACLFLGARLLVAQTTNSAPLTPPADPTQPPVAPPATQILPPIAQPVAPLTPPVAQPVLPNSPDATTNAAPTPSALVVMSPGEARFDTAMSSFASGQWADAVRAFSDFVRDFPDNRHREEALYRLGESYRNLGHTDDALAAYTFQVQGYPEGPLRVTAELRRGAILFDQGKFPDAIPALQIVADKGSGESQQAAKYILGRALLATQKEADGTTLLQAIVAQKKPGKFSGAAAQALAEYDDSKGKYVDALAAWQKALELSKDPTVKATAAARGGWSALQAKLTGDAERLFYAAQALDAAGEPRKVANTGLLRILFEQKRYDEWLTVYTTESDKVLDSARPEVLYDLGHINFLLKKWEASVEGYDKYLKDFSDQDAAATAAYERFLAAVQLDKTKLDTEADAYAKAYPKSPYRPRVRLLEAQDLSRQKRYSDALPLWEGLAGDHGDNSSPRSDILLELARTNDQLGNFAKAATAYRAYLDDLNAHPVTDPKLRAKNVLQTQARLAVCLQKSDQLPAATNAWKAVLSIAPEGSREEETALESLGLIYAKGGPDQETEMVATFRQLLNTFPETPLRGMAAFSVGDSIFKAKDYANAEQLLLQARDTDAKSWMQPATQRLVLGAYGQKDYDKTAEYLKEYDTLPIPTDPQSQIQARIPAALIYWLAETARKADKWDEAEAYYTRVTQHPDPGDLLAGAWWQLGEAQSHRREWADALSSYEKYRQLKPDAKNATQVLLALGRAQLGAQNFEAAKKLGEQSLLQEPEGPHSAASRMLLAEIAFAAKSYAEAARMFATLAVLFDDPQNGPQAMARAADAFEQAGDSKSAADWRQKLKDKYPDFQEEPYL